MPPAFDGDIGKGKPALRLSSNRAFIEGRQVEHVTDGIETRGPVIKSKQVNLAVEYWDGNGIQVIIDRRFFEFEEDAINFPSSGLFFTNAVFPGWDKKPSWAPTEKIGDKTSWLYPSMLYFVKGKVFVTITVMPPDLGVKYTDNIARNIEKKL